MIVFKTADLYDKNTGEKIGSQRVYDHQICDYTGERIGEYENPNSYIVDFNSNDPCFGDGEGERWLYDYERDLHGEEEYDNIDGCHHELFGQTHYVFKHVEGEGYGTEVVQEMIEDALQHIEIWSLDQLLRWSRGQMLERVIKEGKYKITDFLES